MSKSSLEEYVSGHIPKSGKRTLLVRAPVLSEYRIGVKLLQQGKRCEPRVLRIAANNVTSTLYAWPRLFLPNSFPLQKQFGQRSTPSPIAQTGSAHLIRMA